MSFAELIDFIRSALEAGTPVHVILGDNGNAKAGISWSHVCVAELMRLGWVEQAVDLHPKRPLVAACALIDVLPSLYTDTATASGPAIYTFPPERLPYFAGKGTWIVAGLDGYSGALPQMAAYWVRQFDRPVPDGARAIDGFDADSFFACLLEALDGFPPKAIFATPARPRCASGKQTRMQQLQSLIYDYSQQASERSQAIFRDLTTSYSQSRPVSDPFAWAERLERSAELSSRLEGEGRGCSLAPLMAGLADSQTPRVAERFLERAERLYRSNMASERGDYILPQIAAILVKRAKLHSGEAADRMFAEADLLMARAKSGTKAGEVPQLKSWAEMLVDWSERHPNQGESARLFDAALEKLEKALTIKPERMFDRPGPFDQVHLRGLYIRLVERRARRLGKAMPARYFDAARQHCQWLVESRESWRGYFGLGVLAVYRTHTESASAENVLRAIELAPEHKVPLLSDWGTALMESGLLTEAYAKFTKAVALDEKAFIPQVNMSAVRLRQARRGEPALDEAVHHAEIAESLQAGTGAYNLACAAGQRGDRVGVEKWLTHSAEKGYLKDRQAILGDADFHAVANQPWFLKLLDGLCPG